jgi:hypothetical protein
MQSTQWPQRKLSLLQSGPRLPERRQLPPPPLLLPQARRLARCRLLPLPCTLSLRLSLLR